LHESITPLIDLQYIVIDGYDYVPIPEMNFVITHDIHSLMILTFIAVIFLLVCFLPMRVLNMRIFHVPFIIDNAK